MPAKPTMPSRRAALLPRFALLALTLSAVAGLRLPTSALASSDASLPAAAAPVAKDCTANNATSATSDGVNFTFGTDVADTLQTTIKDDTTYARDYGKRTLGVRVDALDVCAYGSADGVAQAESTWIEQPGAYQGRLNFWQSTGAIGVARGIEKTDASASALGFFALTSNGGWKFPSVGQEVVAHEYFHLVQRQLSKYQKDIGPDWLTEGSAEFYAQLVLCDKNSVDFARIRDSLRLSVASYKGTLKDLEDQTVFGSAANVGYSYSLGTLAADALSPNGDMSGFVKYYTDIGSGTAWRDAFIHAFGTSVDAFYGTFSAKSE